MRPFTACSVAILSLAFITVSGRASAQTASHTPQEMFERGLNLMTGAGVNRDDVQAVDYFRRSAEAGYGPAQTAMGFVYEKGIVVPSDPQTAAGWYTRAAATNDRLAQWVLGRMYLTGTGVTRDRNEAMKWLGASAGSGNPFAALLLGAAEEEVAPGPAIPWYEKAARQGLPEAQFRVGRLLAGGRVGTPRKYDGYVWLLVAFESGVSAAGEDLKGLEAQLGTTKVDQAKTEARALRDKTQRTVTSGGCTGWAGELDAVPSTPPIQLQSLCR